MKLNQSKEWYEQSAALEGDSEVGAGSLRRMRRVAVQRVVRRQMQKDLTAFVKKWNNEAVRADERGEVQLADALWSACSHALTARDILKQMPPNDPS